MNKLWLIVRNEYLTDVRAKSFWISTFLFPLAMVAFGGFIGYLAADSDIMKETANPGMGDPSELSVAQLAGMMIGMMLTLFIMIFGAQIFNKVKTEKCNRIVEILATCVDGRTMMFAKIIAVGLVGLTQLVLWMILIGTFATGLIIVLDADINLGHIFGNPVLWKGLLWGLLYFIGGYVFYASMFAAVGAMTDKNNENQEYMTGLTFVLLGAFYVGQFAVSHGGSGLAIWCSFIPFTSPTVGTVTAVSGSIPLWESLLSLLILMASAAGMLALSGKIYTSSLLLKGKRFSPKDILTFLRSK